MKNFVIPFLVIFPLVVFGQTKYVSITNGDWNNNSTWQTGAPPTTILEGDSVIINHDVKLKGDITNKGVIYVSPSGFFDGSNRRLTNEGVAIFDGVSSIKYITLLKESVFKTNNSLLNSGTFSIKDSSTVNLNGTSSLNSFTVENNSFVAINKTATISGSIILENTSTLTINANTFVEYLYVRDNSKLFINDTLEIDKNTLQKEASTVILYSGDLKTKYGYLEGGTFLALGNVIAEQDFKINGADSVFFSKNLSIGRYFDLIGQNVSVGGTLSVDNTSNIKNNASLKILGNAQNYFGSYLTIENSSIYLTGPLEVRKDLRNINSTAVYEDSVFVKENAYLTDANFTSKNSIVVEKNLRFTGSTSASLKNNLTVGKDLFFSNTASTILEGNVFAENIDFYNDATFTVTGNISSTKNINIRNNTGFSVSGNLVAEDVNLLGSSSTTISGNIKLKNNLTLNNTASLFTQSFLEANRLETYGGKLHIGGNLKTDDLARFRGLDSLYINGSLNVKSNVYFQVIDNGIISGNIDVNKKLYVQDNSSVKILGSSINQIGEDIYINTGSLDISGSIEVERDVTMYNGSLAYTDSVFINDDFYLNNSTVSTTGSKYTSIGDKFSIQNNSDFDTDSYLEAFGEVDINLNNPNEISFGGDVLFDDKLKLNNKAILKLLPSANMYVGDDLINYGDSILQFGLLTVEGDYKNHNPAKHVIDQNAQTKIKSLEISGNGIQNNGVLIIENGGKVYGGGVIDGSGVFQVDGGLQVWGTVGGKQDVCSGDGITNPFTRGSVSGAATICNNPSNFQQIGPAPLPVDLVTFEATLEEENIVALFWITASEINNDYFTIEKSKNDEDFSAILKVEGAGTTNIKQVYEATDEVPCNGICYYRLSQTDFDGKTTVYAPVGVVVEKENINNQEVKLYPNPLKSGNRVNIEMPITENQEVNFFINDLVGREYISDITWINMGDFSLIVIEFNQQPPKGIYLISMIVNKEIISKKLYVE